MIDDYFPQGIAKGSAFIGRDQELDWLSNNIQSNHHTLLLAPRRYGKTSLAINTLKTLGIPYVEANFHLALSAKSVEKKILTCVQDLLAKVISKPEKMLKNVQSFFKTSKKRWTLGFKGVFGVEIIPDNTEDSFENIVTALNLIEHVLAKKDKKAVLFIDEVQEINNLPDGKQIAGAIRHFAQASKYLVIIFSGSNRRMLLYMFDDSTMPLYELCDRIILGRIDAAAYNSYFDKVAKKTWGKKLDADVKQLIITLSERHPKRIYNLCYCLWMQCQHKKSPPKENDVIKAWETYLKQRIKDVRYNLSRKSPGQIKLLTLIATGINKELTGKVAQKKINLAGSSITNALVTLEENDYIEKLANGQYRIIDPLIKDILVKYEHENIE